MYFAFGNIFCKYIRTFTFQNSEKSKHNGVRIASQNSFTSVLFCLTQTVYVYWIVIINASGMCITYVSPDLHRST